MPNPNDLVTLSVKELEALTTKSAKQALAENDEKLEEKLGKKIDEAAERMDSNLTKQLEEFRRGYRAEIEEVRQSAAQEIASLTSKNAALEEAIQDSHGKQNDLISAMEKLTISVRKMWHEAQSEKQRAWLNRILVRPIRSGVRGRMALNKDNLAKFLTDTLKDFDGKIFIRMSGKADTNLVAIFIHQNETTGKKFAASAIKLRPKLATELGADVKYDVPPKLRPLRSFVGAILDPIRKLPGVKAEDVSNYRGMVRYKEVPLFPEYCVINEKAIPGFTKMLSTNFPAIQAFDSANLTSIQQSDGILGAIAEAMMIRDCGIPVPFTTDVEMMPEIDQ